jgi:hypothetical protein
MPVKRAEWAPGMRQRGLTKHRHFAPPGRGVRYDQASGEDTRSTWLVGMTCTSPEGVNNLIEGPNISVTIGSLDDPEAARPVLQYSVEHTVSWFPTIATLPGKRTEEFITPDLAARFVGYQHPDHDA